MNNLEITKAYVGNTQVSKIYVGGEAVWPTTPPPPTPVYSAMPLTFEVISAGTIAWFSDTANTMDIDYSLDDGQTWTTITSGPDTEINVSVGDKVQFKGYFHAQSTALPVSFRGTAMFNAYGNAFSIVDATGYTSITTAGSGCLAGVFRCNGLVDASNMVLAPTTVSSRSYYAMFSGCTNLTAAPELPATVLGQYCYQYMFEGCTSLTEAPELPATTLANGCYQLMFYGCTSLTTAPELPATTLADYCYSNMFGSCTSLTQAPELLATTLTESCYYGMFSGCTSLTTAPELPATILADSCYQSMFYGCISLTTAHSILPATTLEVGCYNNMFQGCTSLTTAPELSATTLEMDCCRGMFKGCTSLTTAPSILPATTLANNCYYEMFAGCTSLTTAPELPATLAGTTIGTNSKFYYGMFSGCTNLNYIKCLATNIGTSNTNRITRYWVSGVQTNSGTFVKHPDMTSWPNGVNGRPTNWTVVDAVITNNE